MRRASGVSALFLILCAGANANGPLSVPFFRQEKKGCGAASVAMVAHYWSGKPVGQPVTAPAPKEIYERLYDRERQGIPLATMRRYLGELGFQAVTFRGEWRDLESHLAKGRPVIVGLKQRPSRGLHFAVLTGVDGDQVWLNDPTRSGPQRVKRVEFRKQWSFGDRWVLLATPKAEERSGASQP